MSPFETLKKILLEEKNRDYDNRTVVGGGVERLSDTWAPKAITEVSTVADRLLIEKIAGELRRYPSLDNPGRADVIQSILSDIEERTSIPASPPGQESADRPPAGNVPSQPFVPDSPPAPAPKPSGQPAPGPKVQAPVPQSTLDNLDAPVTELLGIKQGYGERLEKLGINTIGDLLTHYPRRYIDYRTLKHINQLEYGEEVTILAAVWDCHLRDTRRGMKIVSCTLSDQTATIQATWFNQPWLTNKLKPGTLLAVSGKVDEYLGRLVFQSPEWEVVSKKQISTGRLVPVYPLTEGITQNWLRTTINRVVDRWARILPDYLEPARIEHLGMPGLGEAVRQIHFPDNFESLEAARRRLAFDELLFIQLGVLRQRQQWRSVPGRPVQPDQDLVNSFVASLPYSLTGDQNKVLGEISEDIGQAVPMNRLLQGDVGSGKTIVALAAMLGTASDGGQSAMMAPTEILAEQHFRSITQILEQFGTVRAGEQFPVQLLTGSTPAAERDAINQDIAAGRTKLVVGTHALIQETVNFDDLRLAIIDEQHRFGVQQRSLLRDKGYNPHMLVMSATPIPRSLALTLYGDLDLSVISELPPGRQEIETSWMIPTERERAYSIIRTQIERGHQAFIICPLVEESEKIEAKSAVEEHSRLSKEIFPDLRLGLVHGRMKGQDKDAVMNQFHDGDLDILVSTSVVEVGIDVPNATVMLVEGANRFGLAQLHQFRGRVGRGQAKSCCLLLADSSTPEAKARLQIISQTNDGFKLAEEDLKLRGPGEFFGTRQSGLPDIRLATMSDVQLLETARTQAKDIFDHDPQLNLPEHERLAQQVKKFWQNKTDLS